MESLFVLWRVTHDPVYREWGWLMFRAWEKFARVSTGGYTCLSSVLQVLHASFSLQADCMYSLPILSACHKAFVSL